MVQPQGFCLAAGAFPAMLKSVQETESERNSVFVNNNNYTRSRLAIFCMVMAGQLCYNTKVKSIYFLMLMIFFRERLEMKCPFCGYSESKVIDSRPAEEGTTIRRRRECLACQKRFTTYEIIERLPLVVVKRDGSRQTFDRVKLINGMVRACEKRPVTLAQLEAIADDIEQELQSSLEREISTVAIGEMVMSRLKELDEVAYVRFASVYRSFKDINTFMEELSKLLSDK